ncbi:hypothetical protein [Flavobacterium sp.]|uniref:hypothetical protein n=1 Tax=Flavobacterium sp. TaxID=239 RepID=UPI0037BF52D2
MFVSCKEAAENTEAAVDSTAVETPAVDSTAVATDSIETTAKPTENEESNLEDEIMKKEAEHEESEN